MSKRDAFECWSSLQQNPCFPSQCSEVGFQKPGCPLTLSVCGNVSGSLPASALRPHCCGHQLCPLMEGKRMKVNTGGASVFLEPKHSIRWQVEFSLPFFFFFLTILLQGSTWVSADFYLGDQLPLRFTFYTEPPANVVGDRLKWMGPPCLPLLRSNFFPDC